jgi:Trypsin-like peptidase domain
MRQRIAALLVVAALFVSVGCTKSQPVTPQQKAEHLVMFYESDGKTFSGSCTATAIGPAAFMTAEHCNDGDEPNKIVSFDMSTRKFHLLAATFDGRDHVIYLLTESVFNNIADVIPGPYSLKEGGNVYIYGCGGREYPCVLKEGILTSVDHISDVDEASQYAEYSMHVIRGDSGSAIFNDEGKIVALVTYGITYTNDGFWNRLRNWIYEVDYDRHVTGAFTLNFTEKQLDIAKNFDPEVLLWQTQLPRPLLPPTHPNI